MTTDKHSSAFAKCNDCGFWNGVKDFSEIAECRLMPPTETNDDGKGIWPFTWNNGWCGEYKPMGKS